MDEVDEDEFEDDEFEEDTFTCRDCHQKTEYGEGDDMLLLCDNCIDNYNIDKIWDEFDDGKIDEEELATIDLSKYALKKKKGKK